MGLKLRVETKENTSEEVAQTSDEVETNQDKDENVGGSSKLEQETEVVDENVKEDSETVTTLPNAKLSEWAARRYGSAAAKLLQDVKITNS